MLNRKLIKILPPIMLLAGCGFGDESRNSEDGGTSVTVSSLEMVGVSRAEVRNRNAVFVDWEPVEGADSYRVVVVDQSDTQTIAEIDLSCTSNSASELDVTGVIDTENTDIIISDLTGLTNYAVYLQAVRTNPTSEDSEESDGGGNNDSDDTPDNIVRSCVTSRVVGQTSLAPVQNLSALGGVPREVQLSNVLSSEGVLFVTWDESNGADSYEIYIDESKQGEVDLSTPSELVRIHQASGPNFAVPNSSGVGNPILNSQDYDVVVVAVKNASTDPDTGAPIPADRVVSEKVTVTSLPRAPQSVSLQGGVEFINVQWDISNTQANFFSIYLAPSDTDIDILNVGDNVEVFTVSRRDEVNLSDNSLVTLNVTNAITASIEPSTSYHVVVSASNVLGQEGRLSTILSAPVTTLALEQQVLNDTGVFRCADYSFVTDDPSYVPTNMHDSELVGCSDNSDEDLVPEVRQQDAQQGRDNFVATGVLVTDQGVEQEVGEIANGVGFLFGREDLGGRVIDVNNTDDTRCVRDVFTGLKWLSLKAPGSDDFFDSQNTYTWSNSDALTNGGDAGTPNGGVCDADAGATVGTNCDTAAYAQGLNALGFVVDGVVGEIAACDGDWRIPTVSELLSIVHYGGDAFNTNTTQGERLVNTFYFPNMQRGRYWTSTPSAADSTMAKVVDFSTGEVFDAPKSDAYFVRLVSDVE